jgi:hypothetical protein
LQPLESVQEWLLDPVNPSLRYRTLTGLLDLPTGDPLVVQARAAIPESQVVRKIFSRMQPDGYWLHNGKGAGIGYALPDSTHFILAYLAELGMDRQDERVAMAVERYLSLNAPDQPNPAFYEIAPDTSNRQSCLYAYNLRTFILLGYRQDARIQERVQVLLNDWRKDGGYLCDRPSTRPGTKSCYRGALKALMAYSELPDYWQHPRCLALVDYFINRRVLYKRRRPDELVREEVVALRYPFTWAANLLEPLVALSRMGYASHPALQPAWDWLERKSTGSGRYLLDRSQKGLFNAGADGQENGWVTLYAWLALKHR